MQGLIGKDTDFLTLSVMSYDRNDISILFSTPAVLKDLLRRVFAIDVFDIYDEIAKKNISSFEKDKTLFEKQISSIEENPKTAAELQQELKELSDKEKELIEKQSLILENKETKRNEEILNQLPCDKDLQNKCKFCSNIIQKVKNYNECDYNEYDVNEQLRQVRTLIGECNTAIAGLKNTNKHKNDLIEKIKDCECKIAQHKEFRKVVGRDGLPSVILKQSLKVLENTMNNILSDLVKFKISITVSDIDNCIYIYIEDSRRKIAYMGSGMEKFIIELSMRMALSQLCRIQD